MEATEIQVFLGKEEYTTITSSSSSSPSSSSGNYNHHHHHPPLSCYENKVCEEKVYRSVLFATLDASPSMIPTISHLLSDFGLSNILPYEILNSRSFLRAFAYLMCILPKDCPRVCLFIWQEMVQNNPNSNSCDAWIQHFEIAIDREPHPLPKPQPEAEDDRDGIFTFVDHLFRYFVDEDKRLFESLTVLSYEYRQFRIELNNKTHVELGCPSQDRCCICFQEMTIRNNKACLTPCLHLYHPYCLFEKLKRVRRRKRSCPACGFDLSDVAIDFADQQVWSFKYLPPRESIEDLYAKYFECEEEEEG